MKAVIMAGGEGRRLRPLTCTLPKPMAKILGRPIIEYIFDLLCRAEVTEAAVTLGYMPHVVEEAYSEGYGGLSLRFFREDEPLGTAGSVRNAAADFSEDFAVISGDALCGFDLKKIAEYHRAAGADVTVVAVTATDPREYGIIKTGEGNRVTGFIEKPSWNQAVCNLANTGVYIVNPRCLELIPKDKPFDFAADLFPLMLEKNMKICCYRTDDYWCDVGSVQAYLRCHKDAFDGRFKGAEKSVLPQGDYTLVPPVHIGKNAEIGAGAVIGPYAVIGENCSVGRGARVKHSVVLENCCLAPRTSVTGALVCSGAALKKGARTFENSVIGSGCVIGEDAVVRQGVGIWPGKVIGNGATVSSNVKHGGVKAEILCGSGISESGGTDLNAETCLRFGCAIGGGRIVALGNDGSNCAKTMQLAACAGIAESGGTVRDFGRCFEAQLNFLANICGAQAGAFFGGREDKYIAVCAEGGLSVPRRMEREIENAMAKCEFRRAKPEDITEITDMSGVNQLYEQELMRQAPEGLEGMRATFRSANETVENTAAHCAARLGVREGGVIFEISESGTKLRAQTESGSVESENLLALCCLDEMRKGRDIAVPYDSPDFFDELADACGRKVYRYLSTPADGSDSYARRLAAKQFFVRDGLFLAFRLLALMKDKNRSLEELLEEIPRRHIVKKVIKIGFPPSYLASVTGGETPEKTNNAEGVRLRKNGGRVLVIPVRGGETVRILAEAHTVEAAQELCGGIEDIINGANEKL